MYFLFLVVCQITVLIACNARVHTKEEPRLGPCNEQQSYRCATNGECVTIDQLCDFYPHCSDLSDESKELCQHWNQDGCELGQVMCVDVMTLVTDCYNLSEACSGVCTNNPPKAVCEVFNRKTLPVNTAMSQFQQTQQTCDLMDFLDKYVYSPGRNRCPPMYVDVEGICISMVTPIKLPWEETNQFCQSIGGKLASFEDPLNFITVFTYLNEKDFPDSFWTQGHFTEEEGWTWGKPIPLASPFWASYVIMDGYNSYVTSRPLKEGSGKCVLLSQRTGFKMVDTDCGEKHVPLCISELHMAVHFHG